jgi:lysozyme family protein
VTNSLLPPAAMWRLFHRMDKTMARQIYDRALARLLADEGGYSNHPRDPGGPTNFGITIADYRRYAKPGATAADVRAMTVAEAVAIYRAKYWDAMSCDGLPAGVDYAVFDYGVNSGVARAGKVLRRLLALSDQTSAVTADVIAAAGRADACRLVAQICDERLAFLQRLPTWDTFGRGWGRRVAGVRAAASAWAIGGEPCADTTHPTPGKGALPSNTKTKTGAAGVIVAAGGAAAHVSGWQPTIVVLILIATACAVAGALAWLHWRHASGQEAAVPVPANVSPSNPSQGG